MVVRAIADVAPGAELFVSYLSMEHITQPTKLRRSELWAAK